MTERQMEVLRYLEDFIVVKGFSPSLSDIATGLNLRSRSNIHRIVKELARQGFIQKEPNRVRSLVPLDKTIKRITAL